MSTLTWDTGLLSEITTSKAVVLTFSVLTTVPQRTLDIRDSRVVSSMHQQLSTRLPSTTSTLRMRPQDLWWDCTRLAQCLSGSSSLGASPSKLRVRRWFCSSTPRTSTTTTLSTPTQTASRCKSAFWTTDPPGISQQYWMWLRTTTQWTVLSWFVTTPTWGSLLWWTPDARVALPSLRVPWSWCTSADFSLTIGEV